MGSSVTPTALRPASRSATSSVFGATRPSSSSTPPMRRARTTRAAATSSRSDTIENCDDAQKKELEKYIAMPAGERDTKLTELKKAMADAEEEHNALLKTLQATFKESQEKMEKLKEDSAPQIKLLKAATPGPKKDAAKDEV